VAGSSFQGRVALVTGGASGIGAALCRGLAARGAFVVVADLDGAGAREVADALVAAGAGAEAATLDVTRAEDVQALVERVARERGRLDLLFNNAGVGVAGEARELTVAHWARVLDVNLRGVVHGVAAAFPLMARQGSGHIVNTASIMGILPATPLLAPYGASKHAVVSLSRTLRVEGADLGVRVSVACPGMVDTPIHDRSPMIGARPPAPVGLRGIPPAACAEAILRGVARNRAVILVPGHARVLAALARWCPGLVTWVVARYLRRQRRRRSE
jgi:NAD(P)-dependent dehydrogenase (short-subunit alcohol dehydrogenase family)